ncbi:hypothetical protein GG344DRAFT_72668 [Lentinula edodes]|nr:hypothetical protein GG344DRAFT_72668 [Lentinula edodes]
MPNGLSVPMPTFSFAFRAPPSAALYNRVPTMPSSPQGCESFSFEDLSTKTPGAGLSTPQLNPTSASDVKQLFTRQSYPTFAFNFGSLSATEDQPHPSILPRSIVSVQRKDGSFQSAEKGDQYNLRIMSKLFNMEPLKSDFDLNANHQPIQSLFGAFQTWIDTGRMERACLSICHLKLKRSTMVPQQAAPKDKRRMTIHLAKVLIDLYLLNKRFLEAYRFADWIIGASPGTCYLHRRTLQRAGHRTLPILPGSRPCQREAPALITGTGNTIPLSLRSQDSEPYDLDATDRA